MSNLFKLSGKDVLGAVLSGALMALVLYVIQINDVFALDLKNVVNVVVISACTTLVSLLKSLGTDEKGKFLGGVKVK